MLLVVRPGAPSSHIVAGLFVAVVIIESNLIAVVTVLQSILSRIVSAASAAGRVAPAVVSALTSLRQDRSNCKTPIKVSKIGTPTW